MTDSKRIFIDTNIWIYAFLEQDFEKRNKIVNFLEDLYRNREIFVSVQVINEFHYVCLRKFQLEEKEIFEMVNGIKDISNICEISFDTYNTAYDLRTKNKLSFWDSLIVASALENGCSILYSEDMKHNQMIENKLRLINPIKSFT